jgi:bifunctional enzyme CysN/CysC/sulfate adenylyltransferase subunit 1
METATKTEFPLETHLAEYERKELLRFVVVGSVDDGKSTLIGRLLFEGHGLYDDQIAAVRRASRQAGLELDFSLFTDGLKAEREQGITIDVAYRYFATDRRKYIVADTPGHPQYTRNMATGASTADVAIILIDARLGVLAQSRRHAYLSALLGIPHLAVAINKMDLLGFDKSHYESVVESFSRFVSPLGFSSVSFFPVSATGGDNVTSRSVRTPWYDGPTVLEYLESVPTGSEQVLRPFRFPVQLVLRPHLDYRGFAGQLASGRIRVGDEVQALPSGQRSRVIAIDSFEGPLTEAFAPQSVTLRLADEIDLSRGEMLTTSSTPSAATEIDATLVWLGDRPLHPARPYLLKHTTRRVRAQVSKLTGRVDLETLREEPTAHLEKNDIGQVTITCHRPIFCDAYLANRATGAFILIDAQTNETVAAGMITSARSQSDSTREAGAITDEERRRRFGHSGAVLKLPPNVDASVAENLERHLFELGHAVVRVERAEHAAVCARAGLLAIYSGAEVPETNLSLVKLEPEATIESILQRLASAGVLDG